MTHIPRVGLIGPARRVNGTGPFVARFFGELGAPVVAIASRSLETAAQTANQWADHGLSPEPMQSVEELLYREDLDCVAVCSPSIFHEQHVRAAVARNLHVFCEKPLVWGHIGTLHETTLELAQLCLKSGLVLHENTQWVHTLQLFRDVHGDFTPDSVIDFEIELSPQCREPDEMLREAFPHVASLVICAIGVGDLEGIRFVFRPGNLEIFAEIVGGVRRHLRVCLSYAELPPRHAAYALNGRWLRREISENYRIKFEANGVAYDCVDPLKQSVSLFLDKVINADAGGEVEFAQRSVSAAAMTDAVRKALSCETGS